MEKLAVRGYAVKQWWRLRVQKKKGRKTLRWGHQRKRTRANTVHRIAPNAHRTNTVVSHGHRELTCHSTMSIVIPNDKRTCFGAHGSFVCFEPYSWPFLFICIFSIILKNHNFALNSLVCKRGLRSCDTVIIDLCIKSRAIIIILIMYYIFLLY